MITYKLGDATRPEGDGKKVIIHVVNNISVWGAGFVLAISKRWPEVKGQYHQYCSFNDNLLGNVNFVYVDQDLIVANMFAQNGIISQENPHPLDYNALENCLWKVATFARRYKCEVVGPRFGSLRGGGDWNKIEQLINDIMSDINITIYDWNK